MDHACLSRPPAWRPTAVGLILTLAAMAGSANGQMASAEIIDVRLGFRQAVRAGYWLPITVSIKSTNDSFQGTLELAAPDGDGRDASLFVDVFVEKNQSKTFSRYVKIAGQSSVVTCRLLTPAGRLVSRGMADLTNPNQNYQALGATESLVLSIGSPAGLYELSKEPSPDEANAAEIPQVVNCSMLVPEMPTQWFAYEAASAVVMATGSEAFFDNIDPLRISALRSWVRQGGHLVVSVANNWQVVSKSFLGPMLPAELTGLGSTRFSRGLGDLHQCQDSFRPWPRRLTDRYSFQPARAS